MVVFNSKVWSSTEFVVSSLLGTSGTNGNDNNVPTNPSVSNFKPQIVFRIGRKRRCSRHGDEIITPAHHNPGLPATGDHSGQATDELPQLINNTNQSESLNP